LKGLQVLLLALAVQPPVNAASVDQIIASYGGSWRGQFVERGADGHPASKRTITMGNRCSRVAEDARCDQVIDGKPAGAVRYHQRAPGLFDLTDINADGSEHAGGTLQIAGDVWTYPWTEFHQGKPTMLRVTNQFKTRDKIIYEKSLSTDGGKTWRVVGTGSEVRVPAESILPVRVRRLL